VIIGLGLHPGLVPAEFQIVVQTGVGVIQTGLDKQFDPVFLQAPFQQQFAVKIHQQVVSMSAVVAQPGLCSIFVQQIQPRSCLGIASQMPDLFFEIGLIKAELFSIHLRRNGKQQQYDQYPHHLS